LLQVYATAGIAPEVADAPVAVVAAADRCAIVWLVFVCRRRFQKMRRCVARMFFASEPTDVALENARDRPFVETGRAHGAGVPPVDKSS
jgi:hypothetical protein